MENIRKPHSARSKILHNFCIFIVDDESFSRMSQKKTCNLTSSSLLCYDIFKAKEINDLVEIVAKYYLKSLTSFVKVRLQNFGQ